LNKGAKKFVKFFNDSNTYSRQESFGFGSDGFFTLSNYQWPYESYMGRWVKHLKYAWNFKSSGDYTMRERLNGGEVIIQVLLSRLGELESFEMIKSLGSSKAMEESVINAVLSVSQLPPLPKVFPEQNLVVSFKFVYLPY
jgi:TonB family protein